jgi:hypothetical protein
MDGFCCVVGVFWWSRKSLLFEKRGVFQQNQHLTFQLCCSSGLLPRKCFILEEHGRLKKPDGENAPAKAQSDSTITAMPTQTCLAR